MGFFAKVKQMLGIGGLKLELKVESSFPKQDSGEITGSFVVTSKSDQSVKDLTFKLVEEYSTGRGENKSTSEYDLGESKMETAFEIKAGETKSFDFTIPYKLLKSKNDAMKDKGGVVGGLGKLGSMADAEKSVYEVQVDASVAGTAFGPSDSKNIKFV